MAESAADLFAHEPTRLPILFLEPAELAEHLTEMYMDETEECMECAEDGEWSDESFVPFAAITYTESQSGNDDLGVEDAFAYLFWDAKEEHVVWATTDDWSRSNTLESFDVLGVELS